MPKFDPKVFDPKRFDTGLVIVRTTQVVLEPVIAPTDTKARVTQTIVEPVIRPTNEKARATQTIIEVVIHATRVTNITNTCITPVQTAWPYEARSITRCIDATNLSRNIVARNLTREIKDKSLTSISVAKPIPSVTSYASGGRVTQTIVEVVIRP